MKARSLVLLGLSVTAIYAQNVSLKGIRHVQARIIYLDGEGTGPCTEKVLAAVFGVREDDIGTDVELELRKAGLGVDTKSDESLNVLVAGCGGSLPTFHIGIALVEGGTTDRGQHGWVVTWIGDAVASYPSDLRKVLQQSLSKFVNRWLADQ